MDNFYFREFEPLEQGEERSPGPPESESGSKESEQRSGSSGRDLFEDRPKENQKPDRPKKASAEWELQ